MSYSKEKILKQRKFYQTHQPDYLKYQKNIPYARYLVGKILGSLKGRRDKVLEVGSGQGRFTLELSRFVKKLTAVDISEQEIKQLVKAAKQMGIRNIQTEVYDLVTLDKARLLRQFDHIVGFFILHHLPREDYLFIVEKLFGLLSKKGRLSFIEPNNLYPFHIVEMIFQKDMSWRIEQQIYTNYISCFKKACFENGLNLVYCVKFGFFPPPLINRWPVLTRLDQVIERIPFIRQILCPFILLTLEKDQAE